MSKGFFSALSASERQIGPWGSTGSDHPTTAERRLTFLPMSNFGVKLRSNEGRSDVGTFDVPDGRSAVSVLRHLDDARDAGVMGRG